MPPKAKADPSKAKPSPSSAKAAPPAAPPATGGFSPFKSVPPKILWMLLGTFAFICFVVLVSMTYLYTALASEKQHPLEEPMKKLRSAMATGLRSPKLNYENPMRVAEEVVKLPDHIEDAERVYNERKAKYQSLFKKGVRSSGGWQLFGKSLYYVSKGQKTWYDAENFCLSRDAHLASILSDEEQNYINSQLKHSTWIGLSDEEMEGIWEWTDGSGLTIEYWSKGGPSISGDSGDGEKDCTFIEPSSGGPNWNDGNCHELKRWVCKESLEVKGP